MAIAGIEICIDDNQVFGVFGVREPRVRHGGGGDEARGNALPLHVALILLLNMSTGPRNDGMQPFVDIIFLHSAHAARSSITSQSCMSRNGAVQRHTAEDIIVVG
jgi:hypothetical protein